ncbi:MAG TPA: hypothetical protein V6C85_36400 [Allocoleopsis sp.]
MRGAHQQRRSLAASNLPRRDSSLMDGNLSLANRDFNTPEINLPSTWFESRITLEQVRRCFQSARQEIRIASGFFTLRGWGLIRNTPETVRSSECPRPRSRP